MKISKSETARRSASIQVIDFVDLYWSQYTLPVPARIISNRISALLRRCKVTILSLSTMHPCKDRVYTWLTSAGAQYFVPLAVWKAWTESERASILERMENTNSFTGKPKKRGPITRHWSDTSNPNEAEIPEYVKPVRIGEL